MPASVYTRAAPAPPFPDPGPHRRAALIGEGALALSGVHLALSADRPARPVPRPDARRRPTRLIATLALQAERPRRTRTTLPVTASQMPTGPSPPAEASRRPSGLN